VHTSSPMILVAGPDDGAVVTDPAIRYRPIRPPGRRYRIAVTAPLPADRPAPPER